MGFQYGGTLLDMCVLALVEQQDTYGYKLTHEVKEILSVSESTLYPVLRRLTKRSTYRRMISLTMAEIVGIIRSRHKVEKSWSRIVLNGKGMLKR